jgi:DNA-directed RNA polymerase specialized sigma24 family protein
MKHIVMSAPAPTAPGSWRLASNILALPTDRRTVLALFFHERLTLAEIAQVLDKSEDEVAADFYLAHANLGLASMLEKFAGYAERIGA